MDMNYKSAWNIVFTYNRITQLHKMKFWGSSVKKETDETLFLELALRGYDLSKLRENGETAAEIVKIG